jgi:hypothetical protein
MNRKERALTLGFAALAIALVATLYLVAEPPAVVTHRIEARATIVTRENTTLFNGTVWVQNDTALAVLDAASKAGNFSYHTTQYPELGSGASGTFVDSIASEHGVGAEGWVYRTQRHGTWEIPTRSAAVWPVQAGDWVLWAWSTSSLGRGYG